MYIIKGLRTDWLKESVALYVDDLLLFWNDADHFLQGALQILTDFPQTFLLSEYTDQQCPPKSAVLIKQEKFNRVVVQPPCSYVDHNPACLC